MNNFTLRTLTGIGLVVLVLAAVLFGPYSFTALLVLISLLSLREFYRLLEVPVARPYQTAGALLSTVLLLLSLGVASALLNWRWLLLLVPVAFGIFMVALYRRHAKKPFTELAVTFLGVIVIALPLCFFASLPFLAQPMGHYGFELPLSCFVLLWAHDTGAYLTGRAVGKHLLFHRISPKKTWEGSLGGAAVAFAAAYILSGHFKLLSAQEWMILSVIIVVTGTYGDLFKSLLKRSMGVKDSGTILPGHGGMLDRFDSLLGSAPFVYCYLILLGK
jgi:phosphatidate cytidylyltransferase